MNGWQVAALHRLSAEILLHDGVHDPECRYEYKRFDVEELPVYKGTIVSLVTVVGLKGDEGTMAEVFARTYRHITIGRKGGMRLLNAKGKTPVRGPRVWLALSLKS